MPVLDGYEATRRIKASLQGQATVVVALTASAFEHEEDDGALGRLRRLCAQAGS